jgi:hypothetical protein
MSVLIDVSTNVATAAPVIAPVLVLAQMFGTLKRLADITVICY